MSLAEGESGRAGAGYGVERTHLLRHDLDWLPASLRAVRWSVTGTIWGGLTVGLVAATVASKGIVLLLGKGLALATVGGLYAGDRVAKAAVKRRLHGMARGTVDLSRLGSEADGQLVRVRGRVKADRTLPGFLYGVPAVYRRMHFLLGGAPVVHEAAVDFGLVDEAGELIRVEVRGSRLLAPQIERAEYPEVEKFLALPLPLPLEGKAERLRLKLAAGGERPTISASEFLVRDGDLVELVGYKTRVVDPSVAMRLERETPMRAALRSGRELPLLIAPAGG